MARLEDLVIENLEKYSSNNALIWQDGENIIKYFTYERLKENSDLVKRNLSTHGAKFESVVAFMLKDDPFMAVPIILGILQSQCSFMFLSPSKPENLQEKILKSSGAVFIISDYDIQLREWKAKCTFDLEDTTLTLWCTSQSEKDENAKNRQSIAYIITTSGSTGSPKIVRVPHSCIAPNITDLRCRFKISSNDIIFAASPLSFDPIIVDIFLALTCGAALLMVPERLKKMPGKLAKVLKFSNITVMQATPSLFLSFGLEASRSYLLDTDTRLRLIVLGGEPFPSLNVIRDYCEEGNETRFYNIYGITEVSCWASISEVHVLRNRTDSKKFHSQDSVSLGEPLLNTELQVRDSNGDKIFKGEGILYIGGSRFCYVDWETDLKTPVYRSSGDVVSIEHGRIYYKGRADFVVKRMGKRFNLESVEERARESNLLNGAAAVFSIEKRLILFCVPTITDDSNILAQNLKTWFKVVAEPHEIPDEFIVLDNFPLTKHGKIDRNQLLLSRKESLKAENSPVELTELLDGVKQKWIEFCGKEPTDQSNFITEGGDSLSAVSFGHFMNKYTNLETPQFIDVLLNKTWRELLRYVESCLNKTERSASRTDVRNAANAGETSSRGVVIFRRGMDLVQDLPVSDQLVVKLKWKYDMKKCVDASPLVVRNSRTGSAVVYIGSHSSQFTAIDSETGNSLWDISLSDRIESSACCSSDGSRIVACCYSGQIYCIDSLSGQILWTFQTEDQIKCSPIIAGSSAICGSHDRFLYCLDLFSGTLNWKTTFSNSSVFASPAYKQEMATVFAAGLDGSCSAVNIHDATHKWTITLGKPVFSSVVLLGDSVLFGCVDGVLYCCGTDSGEIIWTFQAAGPIFSTPCVVREEEKIIFGCHGNVLYCLGLHGQLLWTFETESPIYATPFACSFRTKETFVFCACTEGFLHVLNLANGNEICKFSTNGDVFSSPVVCGTKIIVGCRDNYVYCFELQ